MCSNKCEMPVMPGRSFAEPTCATQPPANVGERWRGTSRIRMPFDNTCSSAFVAPSAGADVDCFAPFGAAEDFFDELAAWLDVATSEAHNALSAMRRAAAGSSMERLRR